MLALTCDEKELVKDIITCAQHLLHVMANDGGYTDEYNAKVLKEYNDAEPQTSMIALKEALERISWIMKE